MVVGHLLTYRVVTFTEGILTLFLCNTEQRQLLSTCPSLLASEEGGRKHPLVGEKFVKNGKCYAYEFQTLLPKFSLASLQNNFHEAGGPEKLIRDLFFIKNLILFFL